MECALWDIQAIQKHNMGLGTKSFEKMRCCIIAWAFGHALSLFHMPLISQGEDVQNIVIINVSEEPQEAVKPVFSQQAHLNSRFTHRKPPESSLSPLAHSLSCGGSARERKDGSRRWERCKKRNNGEPAKQLAQCQGLKCCQSRDLQPTLRELHLH